MNLQPTHLTNELITLAPLQATDFERLYTIASDPLIWEQHPEHNRYQRDVFQIFFDGAVASGTAFLVFDTQTNQLIGSSRYYDNTPENKSIGIGYTFLSRSHWGGPHNTALKKLMIDYAFQFADVVVFHIGGANMRSQKAVQKLGGVKVSEKDPEGNGVLEQMKFTFELSKHVWLQQ